MRAVVIKEYGSPEVLQLQELPNLEPSRREVRVKVSASALNRSDIELPATNSISIRNSWLGICWSCR